MKVENPRTLSPLAYLRAAIKRKPPFPEGGEGGRIPRLERSQRPAVADERRLATFRRLTGYPDDGYLPLTWPHIAAFPGHFANLLDRRFPLPLVGIVHIRSDIRQHRPIGAGEALRTICVTEGGRDTDKGFEFDLETRAYVGADLVWEGTASMLRRAKKERGLPTTVDRPTLDAVGAANRVWQIPERTARQFARVSGDLNPMHLSPLLARGLGFDGVVVHGMWTLTRAASMHPDLAALPEVRLRCEFKLPLILPATAVYRHWPRPGGGVAFRVLDRDVRKPHAIGEFGRF
jgi:acyl dehydratase